MRIFIQSFGCAKNFADSEKLAGLLKAVGHELVLHFDEKIDLVIFNTCGFIQPAVKENLSAIHQLQELKASGKIKKIMVFGCLFNRYGDELKEKFPNVDFFVKSEDWNSILDFLSSPKLENWQRGTLEEKWSRYLKIVEGCDSFCSYCTIPMIRGRAKSVPMEKLVEEAKFLCSEGAKEICVIGQDPTLYGKDLYGTPKFLELLQALEQNTPDDIWIRLLYLHPNRVTKELIDMVAESKKIVPYLDIPIQHIDEKILEKMNRGGNAANHINEIFRYARAKNPLFALRTTVMVGFPGETELQFKKLLDFMREIRFDRLGAFKYSPEEGTKAANFPNQIDEKTKNKRYEKLMKLQEEISEQRQKNFAGTEMKILVEKIDKTQKIAWGRSYREAPEVDGAVQIPLSKLGEFVNVKIL